MLYTFDAVIRKLIYALWRRPSCRIVPILFITCLPQTFSFSRSCLNAGDNYWRELSENVGLNLRFT